MRSACFFCFFLFRSANEGQSQSGSDHVPSISCIVVCTSPGLHNFEFRVVLYPRLKSPVWPTVQPIAGGFILLQGYLHECNETQLEFDPGSPTSPFKSLSITSSTHCKECTGGIMDSDLKWEIREPSSNSSWASLHSLLHKYPWGKVWIHLSLPSHRLNSRADQGLQHWLTMSLGEGQLNSKCVCSPGEALYERIIAFIMNMISTVLNENRDIKMLIVIAAIFIFLVLVPDLFQVTKEW